MKWEHQLQNLMDLGDATNAISATAQIIQCEMASKAVNYADLSQVVSDLHAVIDRVDELENELAQLVENLWRRSPQQTGVRDQRGPWCSPRRFVWRAINT